MEEAAGAVGDVRTLVDAGPPEHSRYRTLVNRFVGLRRATALEPAIRQLADRLVDSFVGQGEVEFVSGFAGPFPLRVVAGLLGMQPEEDILLRGWADDAAEVIGNPKAALERARRGVGKRSNDGFDGYFRRRIEARRAAPVDGGAQGWFSSDGQYLRGAVRSADPHILDWVGGRKAKRQLGRLRLGTDNVATKQNG